MYNFTLIKRERRHQGIEGKYKDNMFNTLEGVLEVLGLKVFWSWATGGSEMEIF